MKGIRINKLTVLEVLCKERERERMVAIRQAANIHTNTDIHINQITLAATDM